MSALGVSPRGSSHADRRSLRAVPLLVVRRLLRENFWFLPLIMVSGALALANLLLWADRWFAGEYPTDVALAWMQLGGPRGARSLLTALAGAIITVAGVTFSVTTAVLALTTSQFGPRLLRQFLRDRGIQAVLGTFLATFVYTLVVSLALSDVGPLPRIAVLGAVALTLLSVGVFVFFLHHVATHIQADQVVARAAGELEQAIDGVWGDLPEDDRCQLPAPRTGYVTSVDLPGLLRQACRHDLRLRVLCPPGTFVSRGEPLLRLEGEPDGPRPADGVRRDLCDCFYLGVSRTSEQDVESAIEQLVEVGVRALSPALNDHFTAVRCIDRLTAALCRMARREPPHEELADEQGTVRVRMRWLELPRAIRRGFGPLSETGRGSATVLEALAGGIARVGSEVEGGDALRALTLELEALERAAGELAAAGQRQLSGPLRRARDLLDARRLEAGRAAGLLTP